MVKKKKTTLFTLLYFLLHATTALSSFHKINPLGLDQIRQNIKHHFSTENLAQEALHFKYDVPFVLKQPILNIAPVVKQSRTK